MSGLIPSDELDYGPLPKRKITEETCRRFGYATTTLPQHGPVQVAAYRNDDGQVTGHKVRTRDKDFFWLGESKKPCLFGQHLCRDAGRRIIITEGEIDALTVSQVLGNKWQVVSVPNGAPAAKRDLARHIDWLSAFDEVIFCFDEDQPGRDAIAACAPLLPPGKAKIVSLPLKDPNAMLQAGQAGELVEALWAARTWRPDGVKSLGELRAAIMLEPEQGLPWFTPSLTRATFGRRLGECVAIGAGTGIGKTDFITQQVQFDVTELGQKVGLFFLEQPPAETGKRLAGKHAKKRFHIPDGSWTSAELAMALDALDANKSVFLYDHFGACDWDQIRATIRVLAASEGVRLFYLDHLTALAAGEEDERKALERITQELSSTCQELGIWLLFVSHLATPDGKPHEEGGRVMIRHFKGSRAIGFWSHFMLGLERDQQSDDEEARQTTTLRVLKDRYTGLATGRTIDFGYDKETGILFEKEQDPEALAGADNEEF